MSKRKKFRISKSSIGTYVQCPQRWFFAYKSPHPSKTDYARLCGAEIHAHIAGFYQKTRKPRPFFYREIKLAVRAWFNRWQRALAREKGRIIMPSEEMALRFGRLGAVCVANYYRQNFYQPRPVEIESVYRTSYNGVEVIGILDQVRKVSLEFAKNKRPELIKKGKLVPEYDNVVIVDLKSEPAGSGFRNESSVEEKVRAQFSLHEGLEVALYSFLYERKHGKKPLGMFLYNLPAGKTLFTFQNDSNYEKLFLDMKTFLDNVNSEKFERNIAKHCTFCDYLEACLGRNYARYSNPETVYDLGVSPGVFSSEISNLPEKPKQLKLKFG